MPDLQPEKRASDDVLATLQQHIEGCREETVNGDKCWKPAEFVLWGKLLPAKALGPRCYEHAAEHIGHHALASRSGYALVNLWDLANDLAAAIEKNVKGQA